MEVKVSENSAFERTLEVILEHSKVDSAYDKAFGKAARRLALPGFRKGKVPLPMAKKYISEEGLGGDVVDELVPNAYREALVQEKLLPISEPKWELVQRQRGKDLIFKVKFEVKPSLPIEGYKQIAIKAEEYAIGDEPLEQAIEDLRRQHANLIPVEGRPLQDGDSAYVDYVATQDGQEFEGGKAENTLLEIKKENFIPGFLDHIVGLSAGEEKEFDIVFPSNYANTQLAGKEVRFKFKVREVKERQLPELTDEFVKSVSGLDNAAALRADIQERLQANAERRARESVSMRIIQKLLPQVPDKSVPRSLFSWRTNVEIRRRLQELTRAGLTIEKYLESIKTDQQTWVNQQSVVGLMEARIQLLLEAIADLEDLEVKDQEMAQLFEMEAAQRGVPVEELKKLITQESSEELVRYAILSAKVRDFLFENAAITFVAPGTPLEDPVAEIPGEPAEEAAAKPKSKGKSKAKPLEAPEAEADEEEGKAVKTSRAKKAKTEEPPGESPADVQEPQAGSESKVAEEEKPKAKRTAKKKAEA